MVSKKLNAIPLLLLSVALFCIAEIIASNENKYELVRRTNLQSRSFAPTSSEEDPLGNSELLDIVLVASVDGKFHALNRTSGRLLWSMQSPALTFPSTLAPLVRTVHNESLNDEVFIIEPQSGAIYILPSTDSSTQRSPLRKFPFTMSELVDMSPFSYADPDGQPRFFVGRKETSMLLVEVETGKIKASVGGECRWDPFDDLKDEEDGFELDLDQLEADQEEKPAPKVKPTQVFIGRTDYHISISTLPRNGPSPPVQNLSFSTYGPNNQDTLLQSSYRRTKDDAYVQSMPNGELLAFHTYSAVANSDRRPMLWYQHFPNPIVAVFDVLKRPAPSPQLTRAASEFHTFVLLQPQPSLTDLHPSLSLANSPASLPNSDSAYVGLVEETGSLFAMSPQHFPFVAFGGSEGKTGGRKLIDDAPDIVPAVIVDDGDDVRELPVEVDQVTEQRKLREREREQKELIEHTKNTCDSASNVFDLHCYVGVHELEEDVTSIDLYAGAEAKRLQTVETVEKLVAPPSPIPSLDNFSSDAVDATADFEDDDFDTSSATLLFWKWEILVALAVGLMGMMGLTAGRYMSSSSPKRDNSPTRSSAFKDPVEEIHPSTGAVPLSTPSDALIDDSGVVFDSPSAVVQNVSIPIPDNSLTELLMPASSLHLATPPPTATSLPSNPPEAEESEGEGDEVEGIESVENDNVEPGGRKKKMRRKRGKKKKGGVPQPFSDLVNGIAEGKDLNIVSPINAPPPLQAPLSPWPPAPSLVVIPTTPMAQIPKPVQEPVFPPSTLLVSDTILGFGSHGTVVFRGSLQGRSVAVKRLLRDFVTLASREVSILQESDDHPNVIRYYYQETQANFLYIALELCPGSLADVFEGSGDLNLAFTGLDADEQLRSRDEWREIRESIVADPKKAIRQITSGLRHLHALKLVHRDIKPQNILVAAGPGRNLASSSSMSRNVRGTSYRMLISDFGLCKKLDLDQTSFLPTAQGANGAGTFGWRAPEILRGEVKLDNSEDTSSSKGSAGTINGNPSSISSNSSSSSAGTRLTKSVDIFALGCLFYYMLTTGGHPFGDRFEREVNIIKGMKDLSGLEERYGEEGVDAADLIEKMLNADSSRRPDTSTCLLHPFFWDSGRRLNFLQDASDRFEIMCRDPKDPHLLELEKDALKIVGHDWHLRVDKVFIDNLGKFRKYDGKSVQDLLRALRNKKHHYQDLPDNVKRHLGAMPEGYLSYFTRRYPQLFLHVHRVISDSELHSEPMFRTYFELAE